MGLLWVLYGSTHFHNTNFVGLDQVWRLLSIVLGMALKKKHAKKVTKIHYFVAEIISSWLVYELYNLTIYELLFRHAEVDICILYGQLVAWYTGVRPYKGRVPLSQKVSMFKLYQDCSLMTENELYCYYLMT